MFYINARIIMFNLNLCVHLFMLESRQQYIQYMLIYLLNRRSLLPSVCRYTKSSPFTPIFNQIPYVIPLNILSHSILLVLPSHLSLGLSFDIASWSFASHASIVCLLSSIGMTFPNNLSYACWTLSNTGCFIQFKTDLTYCFGAYPV